MTRLGLILILVLAGCVAHTISPSEATHSAMAETIVRINLYTKSKGTLPLSMHVLPVRNNHANRTVDGWHRQLIYNVSPDGSLSITSFGSDGKPGGTDENSDIVMTYRWMDSNGRIIAGDKLWVVDGKVATNPR